MKVIVQGQGEVSLTQREFVAAGGEGAVFARGVTAYKVYSDPAKMLPVGKITELATIRDPNVIKPERVLTDAKTGSPVGYTMRFVKDALPLCQVFPRAFREREGLDHPQMLALVQRFRALVEDVHRAGVLLVDLNEMNFLVDRAFREVYGIDVDSYQTRSYRATALMPSVRDHTVKNNDFTENSDWFSFGCVAFQMLVGIHPFKGKHPTINGLEERMQAGVSVLDPSVSLPRVVYPFTVIPPGYMAWFKAMFVGGQRLAPPTDPGAAPTFVSVTRVILGGAGLDIVEIATFTGPVLGYRENGGIAVAATHDGVYVNGRMVRGPTPVRAVGFTPKMNRPVLAWAEDGALRLFDGASLTDIPVVSRADDVLGSDGRIYIRSGEHLMEVVLVDSGQGVIASTRIAANVLEHATQMFEGMAVQTLLGATYVSVFRAGAAAQMRIGSLDYMRIVDAKCDGNVMMFIVADHGRYDRRAFVIDDRGVITSITQCALVKDITPAGLNFVTLDNGIVVHLTEEEKLEVWSTQDAVSYADPAPRKVKIVEDKALGNDMRLVKHGGRVAFVRGDKLFSMRMK